MGCLGGILGAAQGRWLASSSKRASKPRGHSHGYKYVRAMRSLRSFRPRSHRHCALCSTYWELIASYAYSRRWDAHNPRRCARCSNARSSCSYHTRRSRKRSHASSSRRAYSSRSQRGAPAQGRYPVLTSFAHRRSINSNLSPLRGLLSIPHGSRRSGAYILYIPLPNRSASAAIRCFRRPVEYLFHARPCWTIYSGNIYKTNSKSCRTNFQSRGPERYRCCPGLRFRPYPTPPSRSR